MKESVHPPPPPTPIESAHKKATSSAERLGRALTASVTRRHAVARHPIDLVSTDVLVPPARGYPCYMRPKEPQLLRGHIDGSCESSHVDSADWPAQVAKWLK